jgi:hypothetical protein
MVYSITKRKTKCKICRTEFVKRSISHKVCGKVECAVEFAQREREKQERKELRQRKERIKSIAELTKEAQVPFNKFIRLRDANDPCISCGRHHQGQYHAGHYLSTGARPELRFDEANCHKQCAPCNNHLSGNISLYRVALIKKIGLAEVERLEGPQQPKKYTAEELREIKREYARKAKLLGAN